MTILLYLTIVCLLSLYQGHSVQENIFRRITGCEKHYKRTSTVLVVYNGVSQIECAVKCDFDSECSGYNYCATSDVSSCCLLPTLMTALSCAELDFDDGCAYFHKGPCWNGGLYLRTNGTCLCPYNFAGDHCQRYYIDCIEAYAQGYRNSPVTIVQPSTEIPPFEVKCRLEEGPAARIIKRNKLTTDTFRNKDWNDFKFGFGVPARNNMWLGLEKIRALLSVDDRNYYAKITVDFSGDNKSYIGYLDDFEIASEAEDYKMSFSGYHSESTHSLPNAFTEVGNGYVILGRPFCTPDKDCGECAKNSNSGWWFSDSCEGVNLNLPTDQLVWPNGSHLIPVDRITVDIVPS